MTVLRPLVWARQRCQRAGGDAVLVLPERPLLRPNEVAMLEQLFTCIESQRVPADDDDLELH